MIVIILIHTINISINTKQNIYIYIYVLYVHSSIINPIVLVVDRGVKANHIHNNIYYI